MDDRGLLLLGGSTKEFTRSCQESRETCVGPSWWIWERGARRPSRRPLIRGWTALRAAPLMTIRARRAFRSLAPSEETKSISNLPLSVRRQMTMVKMHAQSRSCALLSVSIVRTA